MDASAPQKPVANLPDSDLLANQVIDRHGLFKAFDRRIEIIRQKQSSKTVEDSSIIWKHLAENKVYDELDYDTRVKTDYLKLKAQASCGLGMNPVEYLLLKDDSLFNARSVFTKQTPTPATRKQACDYEKDDALELHRGETTKDTQSRKVYQVAEFKIDPDEEIHKKLDFTESCELQRKASLQRLQKVNPKIREEIFSFGDPTKLQLAALALGSEEKTFHFQNYPVNLKTTSNSVQMSSDTETANFENPKPDPPSDKKSYLRGGRPAEVSPVDAITTDGVQSPTRLNQVSSPQRLFAPSSSKLRELKIIEVTSSNQQDKIQSIKCIRIEDDLLNQSLNSGDFIELKSSQESATTMNLFFKTPIRERPNSESRSSCDESHRQEAARGVSDSVQSSSCSVNTLMFLFASREDCRLNPSAEKLNKIELAHTLRDSCSQPGQNESVSLEIGGIEQEMYQSVDLKNPCKESRVLSPSQVIEFEAYDKVFRNQNFGFSSMNDTQSFPRASSALTLNYDQVYIEKGLANSNLTQEMVDDYIGQIISNMGNISHISHKEGLSLMSPLKSDDYVDQKSIELRPSLVRCGSPAIIASQNEIVEGGIEIHMFDSNPSNQRSSGTERYYKQLDTPSK